MVHLEACGMCHVLSEVKGVGWLVLGGLKAITNPLSIKQERWPSKFSWGKNFCLALLPLRQMIWCHDDRTEHLAAPSPTSQQATHSWQTNRATTCSNWTIFMHVLFHSVRVPFHSVFHITLAVRGIFCVLLNACKECDSYQVVMTIWTRASGNSQAGQAKTRPLFWYGIHRTMW